MSKKPPAVIVRSTVPTAGPVPAAKPAAVKVLPKVLEQTLVIPKERSHQYFTDRCFRCGEKPRECDKEDCFHKDKICDNCKVSWHCCPTNKVLVAAAAPAHVECPFCDFDIEDDP